MFFKFLFWLSDCLWDLVEKRGILLREKEYVCAIARPAQARCEEGCSKCKTCGEAAKRSKSTFSTLPWGKAQALEASRCYLSMSQILVDSSRLCNRGCCPFFAVAFAGCVAKTVSSECLRLWQSFKRSKILRNLTCASCLLLWSSLFEEYTAWVDSKRFQWFRTCDASTGGSKRMAHVGRDPHSGGCFSTINNYLSRHFQTYFWNGKTITSFCYSCFQLHQCFFFNPFSFFKLRDRFAWCIWPTNSIYSAYKNLPHSVPQSRWHWGQTFLDVRIGSSTANWFHDCIQIA